MSRVKVTIGKNEPIIFIGEILFEGKDELGDQTPCQAIEIREVAEGKPNSKKTIRFRTPFCSWEILEEDGDDYFELKAHAEGW